MKTIEHLPDAPLATDNQTNFNLKAFTFVSAMQKFVDETNALADEIMALSIASPLWHMGLKPGMTIKWPANSNFPPGMLLCNGAEISRSVYVDLFDVLGTFYGAGNGTTTFNLPDCRDRVSVGAGGLYAVGSKGGSKDAVTVAHTHGVTVNDPGHVHAIYVKTTYDVLNASGMGWNASGSFANTGTFSSTTGISASISTSGSSGIGANMPPYLAEYTLIKY